MLRCALFSLTLATSILTCRADISLDTGFQHPPATTRPWVYWFWNNGAVSQEGITADLEAMQRVGIGGVIIMDVLERFAPPRGNAVFFSDTWRTLFKHAVREAGRLGLEVNMTNGPGWTGSSGKWISPELSMQALTVSNTEIEGPVHFDRRLPRPPAITPPQRDTRDSTVAPAAFYRDISVIAFSQPENDTVPTSAVLDLTAKMDQDGRLTWEAPAGKWIIQRIGHSSTGVRTRPPVLGGNGLECDKLSRAAMDVHFAGMMGPLIQDIGPLAGKTLTATHIDSWEVKGQNWTPLFREEFRKRRGYDPVKWLPCITGVVQESINGKTTTHYVWNIGGKEMADRFRWDFQQTISELLADNYAGRLAELVHAHGMRLSIEGYNLNHIGDEGTYAARADEPMSEFWNPFRYGVNETKRKGHQMASVAHVHGLPIVGAEAFTSGDDERWMMHPATIKALGDQQFSQGINRFVFHRYAHQPYLDRAPGATMGPWGLHYERTQTWWEMSGAWHQYLARCQFMLRRGLFVADLLYLRPELPNLTYFDPIPTPPVGYAYDEISAEALIGRATARNGRIVLPDGMSYRILVLPAVQAMTPALADKLSALARAGATIFANGPAPSMSPGLQNHPQCDRDVAATAAELWGKNESKDIQQHAFGKGRLVSGTPLSQLLALTAGPADFASDANLSWIHRREAEVDHYFVASAADKATSARCTFRVTGKAPEIWDPETGRQRFAVCYEEKDGRITVPLDFSPSGSCFIVFREPAATRPATASTNLPTSKVLATLTGPWFVEFSPKMGLSAAPTVFPELASWHLHAEPDVRYYSGTAAYRKSFTWPSTAACLNSGPIHLDLGDVAVMARVILNGKDCGVAWKKPFRIDISAALHSGDNALQIEVANLWPNRLIGDASLPEAQRHTWSSWQPFTSDTPLLPSGLLGPIMIVAEDTP